MPDIGADAMYNAAAEKGTIDAIPEISGLAVWHKGHIGIYIGDGKVIQAANTKAGVKEALVLADRYGADKEIVELGALLHDIASVSEVGTRFGY